MKIDSGILRNFKFDVLQKSELRPTKSRIRNSIFDVLYSKISFSDYYFFDLFAGTGAVGIEALNRGFKKSFFFESNPEIFTSLKKTLSRLPQKLDFEFYLGNSLSSFQKLSLSQRQTPKVFFMDAPFHLNLESNWVDFIQKELDCFLIIERNKDLSDLLEHKKITPICLKKYGKVYLHFLHFKGNQKRSIL